ADINPKKGVYDFSYLDEIMDEWGEKGYVFSMRMCTFQNENRRWDNNQNSSPAWIHEEAGAKGYFYEIHDILDPSIKYEGTSWEPDYGDDIFMGYIGEALMRLGEKYGHDPRLEYFDVGTFGRFGEGHTRNRKYSEAELRRHIDVTRAAFPDKLVLVNDDMLRHNPAATASLTDYCVKNGVGIRDDSICVNGVARGFPTYDTLRDPKLFDPFVDRFPVDIEFAHGELIDADVWKGGFPAMDSLRRTKCTYAGFHDYPGRFLENNYWFAEYCANRLGYWYRPDALYLDAHGGSITVYNLGWAPSYRDYTLKLILKKDDGSELDMGQIAGSACMKELCATTCSFTFDAPIAPGEYGVVLTMLDENGAQIRMALDAKCETNGRNAVGKITIE
ncbi:MAG: hypothetical protein J6C52_05565, partial [Clostridia bacterium]|nr:hypothetical protein [Clostridia bacterium]